MEAEFGPPQQRDDGVVDWECTRKKAWKVANLFKTRETVALMERMDEVFDRGPDTVDGRPTFEKFLIDNGRLTEPLEKTLLLWRSLGGDEAFERATAYARSKLRKPSLSLYQVLLRRYKPTERRVHPSHFDSHARGTMVIALNDNFDGGYYFCDDTTRRFVSLRPGEAFLHSFDLRHGVHVQSGTRYSCVLWFKTPRTAKNGSTPWFNRRAETEKDAAYMVASLLLNKQDVNPRLLAALFERAANLGSTDAALNRGVLAAQEDDHETAVKWFRKAKNATAMRYLAVSYIHGKGVDRSATKATRWLHRAGAAGDSDALHALSRLQNDRNLLIQAADHGHPDACLDLAEGLLMTNVDECPLALKRAIANGADPSRSHYLLGRLYSTDRYQNLTEATRCFAIASAVPGAHWMYLDAGNRLTTLYCGGFVSQASRPLYLLSGNESKTDEDPGLFLHGRESRGREVFRPLILTS